MSVRRALQVASQIRAEPATADELATRADVDIGTVRGWLRDMQAAGLVEQRGTAETGRRGSKPYVWAWKGSK